MSSPNIPHLVDAKDALASFLATLLGDAPTVEIDAPVATPITEAQPQSMAYVSLVSSTGFVVMLDGGWVRLLSQAMLGEVMEIDDEGANDLVTELAGQGYGAVRNALGGQGVSLPNATFTAYPPGTGFPAGALADPIVEVSFVLRVGSDSYGGSAILPAPPPPEAAAQKAPQGAPQKASQTAPPTAPQAAPLAAPQAVTSQKPAASPIDISPAAFPDLGDESLGAGDGTGNTFELLAEVELEVTVELGRRRLPLADLLRLTNGSVIELEKLVGEPLEVYANGRLIAEGEAVVIDDQFGIRITNLASTRQRARAFL